MEADLKLRTFWNRGRGTGIRFPDTPNVDYDTVDLEVEQNLSLPHSNTMIVGANYRRNQFESRIFTPGLLVQDLWAIFFQNEWKPGERFTVIASARLDRHPLTKLNFSPRGSLIYTAHENHRFRLSAGSSFRNPTFTENHLDLIQSFPNPDVDFPDPPYTTIEENTVGSRNVKAERIVMGEVAYSNRLGRVKNRLVGFLYELKDILAGLL